MSQGSEQLIDFFTLSTQSKALSDTYLRHLLSPRFIIMPDVVTAKVYPAYIALAVYIIKCLNHISHNLARR